MLAVRLTPFVRRGLLIALAAPFLIFPNYYPGLTIASALLVIAFWLWGDHRHLPTTPFCVALTFWMLAVLAGALVSADPDLTLPKLTNLILGLTVWRWLADGFKNELERRLAVGSFLVVGGGMVILGGLGTHWPTDMPLIAHVTARLPDQLISLSVMPPGGIQANQLGGTILLPLLLLLSFLVDRGSRARSHVSQISVLSVSLLLGSLLLVTLLMLTQSRSSWLGAAAGVVVLLGLWGRFWPPQARWTGTALGLLVFLTVTIGLFWQLRQAEAPSSDPPLGGDLNTLVSRREIWHWGLVAVRDFPIAGVGLGAFRRVAPRLYPWTISPDYDIAHAHNIFLQVALDTGVPGLVAYIALLVIAISIGWKAAQRRPHDRPLLLGLLAGLAALHMYGLTDTLAPGSKPGLLFWMALGLIAACARTRPPAETERHLVDSRSS